jgi:hypothetical protein
VPTVVAPADLDDLKRILDARADVVQSLGTDLSGRLAAATWSGPAADQLRSTVSDLQSKLASDADRVRAASAILARLSAALSSELEHLGVVEAKVQAWFAANPPSSPTPPPWPQHALPPTGDPGWRAVEQAFAPLGVL